MNQMIDNQHVKKHKRNTFWSKFFIFMIIVIALSFALASNLSNNPSILTSSNNPQPVVESDKTVKLTAIGDIMCHSTNFKAAYNSSAKSYNFMPVFEQIKDYTSAADLTIGNLETTLSGSARGYSGYPTFNTPEILAQNLKDIGIDVVSTANNHSLDKGFSGLESTIKELDKVGLEHTGTFTSKESQNTILTKDVNGIKFAFLSFTYGTNGIPVPSGKDYCINLIDKNLIKEQISLAKQQNPDVICVNMHWGIEYKILQNAEQEDLANFLFENGVDIILGSHPHVLQPMEKRTITLSDGSKKDGFVIYSLGNFMSGQNDSDPKNSIILNMQITKHSDGKITIDSYDYIPIYMYNQNTSDSNKYKIIDIKSAIKLYESGDKKINATLYKTLQGALTRIRKIMGE